MSLTPSRHLPERPSLEQLRKQAREHLDTLRAADPAVTLAAAQHALARGYRFESWPTLVPTSSRSSRQVACCDPPRCNPMKSCCGRRAAEPTSGR